jgi:hypothetical protein
MHLILGKDAWLTSARQEMASGERQAANRKIAEENLFNLWVRRSNRQKLKPSNVVVVNRFVG